MGKNKISNYGCLTYLYMQKYIELEKIVKDKFCEAFSYLDNEIVKKVIYLQGARDITSIQLQYADGYINNGNLKYKETSILNKLSIANIVAINSGKVCVDAFNIDIENFERKETYGFVYVVRAVLSMRNRIAHMNFEENGFAEKECVGNLSNGYIKKNLPKELDIIEKNNIDEIEISIISNYLYMTSLLKTIKESTYV
jgi:hypothetical protein